MKVSDGLAEKRPIGSILNCSATVRNVRIEFPEGNDVVSDLEVFNKLPMESLERHQPVELIAAVHM